MIIRILFLYYKYLLSKILYFGKVKFKGFTVVYSDRQSKIDFSKEGRIEVNSYPLSNLLGMSQRAIFVARYGGHISVGKKCAISGSTLYSMSSITVGDGTFIGTNCKIIDNDFHPLDYVLRRKYNANKIKKRPVYIGEECFIGSNSIILKGTVLGRHCVVGAGSVVSGTFPDDVVIGGNPAKIIRHLN